jgi:hypothetical protein
LPATTQPYYPYDGTKRGYFYSVSGTAASVLQTLTNKHIRKEQIVVMKDDATYAVYRIN